MSALQPAMAAFGAARWRVTGTALPLSWAEGPERLAAEAARPRGTGAPQYLFDATVTPPCSATWTSPPSPT